MTDAGSEFQTDAGSEFQTDDAENNAYVIVFLDFADAIYWRDWRNLSSDVNMST